jgi:hypothetical protein
VSKQTETPAFDFDVFEALDHYSGDWRKVAADMAYYAYHEVTESAAVRFTDSFYWKKEGIPHMEEMGQHIADALNAAVEMAGLFGYCVGKTAPTGIEDIEGWPERAWALAGFGTVAEAEQPEGDHA